MSDISNLIGSFYLISGLVIIVAVICYLVWAAGLVKVLQYFRYRDTWMAFIPILNVVALVNCMKEDANGNINFFGKTVTKRFLYGVIIIHMIAICCIPMVGSLLPSVIGVVWHAVIYNDLLSRSNTDGNETLLAILGSLFVIVWVVLCYTQFKGRVPKDDNYIVDGIV